jgi:two-component system, sensor histidine kinase LadS
MKKRLFFTICFWSLTIALGFGKDTLFLKGINDNHFLNRQLIEVVEDPYHKWNIQQISSPEFNKLFSSIKTEFPENEHPGSAYWIKFTLQNKAPERKWVFECYNFKVRFVEIYFPDEKGNYHLERSGSGLNFKERTLQHKNLDFLLPSTIDKPTTIYVKFISYDAVRVRFNIRSYEQFTGYALNEYFLLGIFYGMIVIIVLYNFFLFLRLKDEAYLYYALYAVFVGTFSMVQDGTGFQYLWPNYPQFNPYALFFCSAVMIVFMIMYTKSFLETELRLPLMNKILNCAIVLRILLFFVQIFVLSEFDNYIWVDIIPYLLVYLAAIIAYQRKNYSALFFVLGFSVLFIGFTVNTLRIYKLIPSILLTTYIINIAVILEMLLLSMALAERVKKIRENELIKENLNRELELKVKERTEALLIQKNVIEEKVKTLDTFIYKASHDIKGPLKSLIGIADLGLKDTKENAHIYFEHALKTAKKLDAIIKDLLHITKVNNANIELSEIDFK